MKKFCVFLMTILSIFMIAGCSSGGGGGHEYPDDDICRVEIIVNDEYCETIKVARGDRINPDEVIAIAESFKPDYKLVDIYFDFKDRITHDTEIRVIMKPMRDDGDVFVVDIIINDDYVDSFKVKAGAMISPKDLNLEKYRPGWKVIDIVFDFDKPIYEDTRILVYMESGGNPDKYEYNVKLMANGKLIDELTVPRGTILDEEKFKSMLPEFENYKFTGFDYNFNEPITENRIIHAIYVLNLPASKKCQVEIFVLDELWAQFEIERGGYISPEMISIPNIPGYTFVGFSFDFDNPVEKNIIIKAEMKKDNGHDSHDGYRVYIDFGYQFEVVEMIVKEGEEIKLPKIPNNPGYILLGFDYEGRLVNPPFDFKLDHDIKLIARWKKATGEYVLTIDNGFEVKTLNYDKDEKLELPIPERKGYRFDGYFIDGDLSKPVDLNDVYLWNSDITIVAKWTEVGDKKINITYELNGGNLPFELPDSIQAGKFYPLPNVDKKNSDSMYVGWYLEPDFKTKIENLNELTADSTLYVRFINLREIKITYELNGGINNPGNAENLRETYGSLYDPTHPDNRRFGGWYLDSEFKTGRIENLVFDDERFHESFTLYACWLDKPNKVTVDLGYEGAVNKSYDVWFGERPSIHDPYRDGYEFTGFTYNDKPIDIHKPFTFDSDITIVATWKLKTYKITYFVDNIEFTEIGDNKLSYTYGDEFALIPIKVVGKEFLGFYLDSEYREKIEKIDETQHSDLRIFIRFSKGKVNISYDLAGGINHQDNPATIELDEWFAPKNPTREGYRFTGWYLADDTRFFDSVITGDLSLKAGWEANNYIIYVIGEDDLNVTYDQEYKLPTIVRDGYEFLGYTLYSEEFPQTGIYKFTDNIRIFPNLRAIEYKINYIVPKGTVLGEELVGSYTVDDGYIYLKETVLNEGKKFAGWYLDKEFTKPVDRINSNDAKDINLYGKFSDIVYKINFNTETDTGVSSINVVYGEPFKLPAAKDRDGMHFVSWTLSSGTEFNHEIYPYHEDIDLWAKFANDHRTTITYKLDGGTNHKDNLTVYDADQIILYPAVKKGYKFLGWTTDLNLFVNLIDKIDNPEEAYTLYAVFEKEYYSINVYSDGIYERSVVTSFEGKYNINEAHVSKPGYKPIGYTCDGVDIEAEGTYPYDHSIDVDVKYEIKTYTITYEEASNLENTNPTTFTINDQFKLKEIKKAGYRFVGFKYRYTSYGNYLGYIYEINHLNSNIYLMPVYELEEYKINYVTDSEGLQFDFNTYDIKTNVILSVKNPTAGYDYEFYLDGVKITKIPVNSIGDKEITVKEINKIYKLTIDFCAPFEQEAKFENKVIEIAYDAEFDLNKYIPEGYKCTRVSGYFTELTDKYLFTENAKVSITLNKISYNISVDSKDNNLGIPTTWFYGDVIILPDDNKKHYKFIGWFDKAGNQITEIKNLTANIEIESRFEENYTTVVIDYGTRLGTKEYRVRSIEGITLYDINLPNEKFIGYLNTATNEYLEKNDYNSYVIYPDTKLNLRAMFEEEHNITILNRDGSSLETIKAKYNDRIDLMPYWPKALENEEFIGFEYTYKGETIRVLDYLVVPDRIDFELKPVFAKVGTDFAYTNVTSEADGTSKIVGIRITKWNDTKAQEIIIPDYYEGLKVLEIAPGAFDDTNATRLVLGANITHLESRTFYNASNLKHIVMNESIKQENITGLQFNELHSIELFTKINIRKFSDNFKKINLGNGNIQEQVRVILNYTPEFDNNLAEDVFGGLSTTKILLETKNFVSLTGAMWLGRLANIISYKPDASLVEIETGGLDHNVELHLASIDDLLKIKRSYDADYDKSNIPYVYVDGKPVKDIYVKEGTRIIPEGAYSNIRYDNLIIPASVTTIQNSAFAVVLGANIYIPASITSMGKKLFTQSSVKVYYGGSEEKWNSLYTKEQGVDGYTIKFDTPYLYDFNDGSISYNYYVDYSGITHIYDLHIINTTKEIVDLREFGENKVIHSISKSLANYTACSNLKVVVLPKSVKAISYEQDFLKSDSHILVVATAPNGLAIQPSYSLPKKFTSFYTNVAEVSNLLKLEFVKNERFEYALINNKYAHIFKVNEAAFTNGNLDFDQDLEFKNRIILTIQPGVLANIKANEIVLPSNMNNISSSLFAKSQLQKLVLGSGVRRIEARAFADATIDTLVLNKGLESLEVGAAGDRENPSHINKVVAPSILDYLNISFASVYSNFFYAENPNEELIVDGKKVTNLVIEHQSKQALRIEYQLNYYEGLKSLTIKSPVEFTGPWNLGLKLEAYHFDTLEDLAKPKLTGSGYIYSPFEDDNSDAKIYVGNELFKAIHLDGTGHYDSNIFRDYSHLTNIYIDKPHHNYLNFGSNNGNVIFNSLNDLLGMTHEEYANLYLNRNVYIMENGTPKLVEEITLPDSITVIPARAFAYIKSLRKVNHNGQIIEIGDYAFEGCEALTNFNFNGVEIINMGAFKYTGLASVDLTTVQSIYKQAFSYTELRSVNINHDMAIKPFAFAYNYNLHTVRIGDMVKDADLEGFICNRINYLYIGAKVERIDFNPSKYNSEYTRGFSSLLDDQVSYIDLSKDNPNLKTTTEDGNYLHGIFDAHLTEALVVLNGTYLPKTTRRIYSNPTSYDYFNVYYEGSSMEYGDVLKPATNNDRVKPTYNVSPDKCFRIYNDGVIYKGQIEGKEFVVNDIYLTHNSTNSFDLNALANMRIWNNGIYKNLTPRAIKGLNSGGANLKCNKFTKEIILPEGLEIIGRIDYLESLTSVILPSTLKTIGAHAFHSATNLKTIAIPESVKAIEEYAFDNTAITSLSLPNSLTSLNVYALPEGLKTLSFKSISTMLNLEINYSTLKPSFEVLIGERKLTNLKITSDMHKDSTISLIGNYDTVITDRSVNIINVCGVVERVFAENERFSNQIGYVKNISMGRNISNIRFVDTPQYSYYIGNDKIVTELFYKQYTSNIFNPYGDLLDKEIEIESIAPNGLDAVNNITIFAKAKIRHNNLTVIGLINELKGRLTTIKYDLTNHEYLKDIEYVENNDYRYILETYTENGTDKQMAYALELINPNKTFYNVVEDFKNIKVDDGIKAIEATGAKVIYTNTYIYDLPENALNFIKPNYAEDKVFGRHYYYSAINTIEEISDENFDYIIINNRSIYLTKLNNKNLKRFEFKELYPEMNLLGMHDGLFSNVEMDYLNIPSGVELLGYNLIKGSTFNNLIINVNPNKEFNSFADALEIRALEANQKIDLTTLIPNTKEFRAIGYGIFDLHNSSSVTKLVADNGARFENIKLASLKSYEGEVEGLDELLVINPQIESIHLRTFEADYYKRITGKNIHYAYIEPELNDIYGILTYYPNLEVIELSDKTKKLDYGIHALTDYDNLKFVINGYDKIEILNNFYIPAYMVTGETFKSIEEKTNETYRYSILNDKYVYVSEVLDKSLTKVDLTSIEGKPVVGIGMKTFKGLALESINLGENIEAIGANAFSNLSKPIDIVLPDSLKMIGKAAFNKTLINSISFGSSITTYGAFTITEIKHLIFRHPNIMINKKAFDSQVKIDLVSGDTAAVRELLEYTRRAEFSQGDRIDCLSKESNRYSINYLEEVIIGPNIKTIGESAFHGANGLKKIVIPDTVTEIEADAFYDSVLEEVVLPKSITSIPKGAFRSTNLKTIVIPGNIKTIGDYAFENTVKLTSVKFEEGVEEIGNQTFKNTPSLKLVTLPKSLKKLGQENFSNEYGIHAEVINVQSNFEYGYLAAIYLGVLEGLDFDTTHLNSYKTKIYDTIITSREFISTDKYDYELLNGHIAERVKVNKAYLDNIDLVNDFNNIEVRSLADDPFKNVTKVDYLRLPACLRDFSPYDIFHLAYDNLYLDSNELYEKLYVSYTLDNYSYARNYYNLYVNDKLVTEMTAISADNHYGKIAYIDSLEKVSLDGKLNNINSQVFVGLRNVTELVIPEGITDFNYELFDDLPSLKMLKYPEGMKIARELRCFADDDEHMLILPKTIEEIELRNKHNAYYEGSIDDLRKLVATSQDYNITPVNEKITEFKTINDGEFSFTLINNKLVYNLDVVNQKHRDFDFNKAYPDYELREIDITNSKRNLQYDKFIIPETVEIISIPDSYSRIFIDNFYIESFASYLEAIVNIHTRANHIFIEGKEFKGNILNIDLADTKLENITIRSNTLDIFNNLDEININSEKVTSIENEIYTYNLYNVTMRISKFVTNIYGTPISLSDNNKIIIDPENENFYGDGSYIMQKVAGPDNKILNRLIAASSNKSMPLNVDILSKNAISNTSIYLVKSIKYIEADALNGYWHIYYEGSKEEFSQILFEDSTESDAYDVIYNTVHPGFDNY